ncbi:MAG: D-alanyl-D-alanine carboxypeptidase/D-alanyl-D-alanine-endopeptidase, partial [Gammaproteobacteria bacterium]
MTVQSSFWSNGVSMFAAALTLICAGSAAANEATAKAASGQLPPTVQRVLNNHRVEAGDISIFVQSLSNDKPLLAVNAGVARNPASTIKLLGTHLALDYLGPAYTWKTEIYTRGQLKGGVLNGDLIIKGYGDPYIVLERLWLLVRELRQRGLQQINGDLVIDNSYFEPDKTDPAEFDGQELRTYNVAPEALMVNFQTVRFMFRPSAEKQQVQIIADPKPDNLEIVNQLKLRSGYCSGYQNGIRMD